MTETTSALDTTANARTVETFLYSLQDQDFDAAEAVMADDILWQNVSRPGLHTEWLMNGMSFEAHGATWDLGTDFWSIA